MPTTAYSSCIGLPHLLPPPAAPPGHSDKVINVSRHHRNPFVLRSYSGSLMLSQPSVIARLMGMDDAAPPSVPTTTTTILLIKPPPSSSNTNTARMMHMMKQDKDPQSRHGSRSCSASHHCLSKANIKPRPPWHHRRRRRHPQEDLLRKIRDDFQAWQQRKSTTSSKPALLEQDDIRSGKSSGGRGKDGRSYDVQMIARENLRREKMARYGYGGKTETAHVEQEEEDMKNAAAAAAAERRHGDSEVSEVNGEPDQHGCHGAVMPDKSRGGEPAPVMTRIAVLRPTGGIQHGPAVFGTTATKAAKRDVGMEEFLQEVKERLKREMTVVIGGPGSDDADGTKQQQQRTAGGRRAAMARQIRETIMAKVGAGGKRLYARSESFRVFRGDRKRAAAVAKSPEHRMLLKSVIVPRTTGTLSSSPKRTRKGLMECLSGRAGCLDDRQSCTGVSGVGMTAVASPPPRVLVRSFSAPASAGISGALVGDMACEGADVRNRSSSFSFLRGTSVPLPSFSLGGKLLTMMQFSKNTKSSSSPQPSSNGRADSLSELSPKCSSELDARTSDESPSSCCKSSGASADDPYKVYAAEVLVVDAGSPCDDGDGGWSSSEDETSIARTDSSMVLAPIIIGDDDVFDEVDEESCYYCNGKNAGEDDDDDNDRRRHRRMLLDLANEVALLQAAVVGSSRTSLRRWAVLSPSEEEEDEATTAGSGNGASTTVEDMVEREVMRSPWLAAAQVQEDVSVVVGKMERAIFDQLVAQLARELFVSD